MDIVQRVLSLLFPPAEGLAVLVVIGGFIVILSIRDLLRGYWHLQFERRALSIVDDRLADAPGRIVAPEEFAALVKELPANSIVLDFARALWDIRLVSNPDMEALSTMLAQSQAARLGSPALPPTSSCWSGCSERSSVWLAWWGTWI